MYDVQTELHLAYIATYKCDTHGPDARNSAIVKFQDKQYELRQEKYVFKGK